MGDADKKESAEQKAANQPARITATDPDPDVPPAAPKAQLTPTVETLDPADEPTKKKSSPLARFLRKTGFERDDVDIVHEDQRVFGTVQGGKYRLNKNGDVITLKGPVAPTPEEVEG